MSTIENGKFLSQPQLNPQGQFFVDDCSSSENKVSQAKSIILFVVEKSLKKIFLKAIHMMNLPK